MKEKPTYEELLKINRELTETNQQHESLFQNMSSGFILLELIFDEDKEFLATKIIDVNPFFDTLIGVKKKSIIGKCAEEVFGTKFLDKFKAYLDLSKITKPERIEYYY